MEQELYRSRNVSKCVKAAYTLFNTNFKRIFLKLWLPVLVLSMFISWSIKMDLETMLFSSEMALFDNSYLVLYGCMFLLTLGAYVWVLAHVFKLLNAQGLRKNMVKVFKFYVVCLAIIFVVCFIIGLILGVITGFMNVLHAQQDGSNTYLMMVFLGCMGGMLVTFILMLPLYYVFMQYMIEENKLRKSFFPSLKVGFRHWGFLFIVFFVILLIALIFVSVMLMPVSVLVISQIESMNSMALGDPSGLPSYFGWLYFITFTIGFFILMFFFTWEIFVLYYAYGSIKRNEMDREKQKKELISKDSTYTS